jgi:hypothetical protein
VGRRGGAAQVNPNKSQVIAFILRMWSCGLTQQSANRHEIQNMLGVEISTKTSPTYTFIVYIENIN